MSDPVAADAHLFKIPEEIDDENNPGEYDGCIAGRPARQQAIRMLFGATVGERFGRRCLVGKQQLVYYGYMAPLLAKTRLYSGTPELFLMDGDLAVMSHIDMSHEAQRKSI